MARLILGACHSQREHSTPDITLHCWKGGFQEGQASKRAMWATDEGGGAECSALKSTQPDARAPVRDGMNVDALGAAATRPPESVVTALVRMERPGDCTVWCEESGPHSANSQDPSSRAVTLRPPGARVTHPPVQHAAIKLSSARYNRPSNGFAAIVRKSTAPVRLALGGPRAASTLRDHAGSKVSCGRLLSQPMRAPAGSMQGPMFLAFTQPYGGRTRGQDRHYSSHLTGVWPLRRHQSKRNPGWLAGATPRFTTPCPP